jgi:hypothetical protein
LYPELNFEADARPPGGSFLTPVQLRRLDYAGVRSGVGLCLRQPQLRGERRFERPRRGTDDQGRASRTRTVEQVDDFAGRVKAKRVELAPVQAVLSRGKAEQWLVSGWEVVANLESDIRKLCEVGGRRFRVVALLPTEIRASWEPGLHLNPQLGRIPAKMRAELTSAEIAMSGSYFDDVLLDPRRYGIENTTDKVRRPGAVRRRRDVVCTERIVSHPEAIHMNV